MRRTVTHFLLLLLLAISSSVMAADVVTVNGIKYNAKNAEVVGADPIKNGVLTIPESVVINGKKQAVTSIGEAAFERRNDIREVKLPSSLKSIGKYVFYQNSSLESIIIPENVETLGYSAFYECTKLKSISFSDKMTTIPSECCRKCVSLKDIKFPKNLKKIEGEAFRECESLTEIVIPDQVEIIEFYTFSGCSRLAKVVIPASVKKIGASAFGGCAKLKSIIFLGTVPPVETFKEEILYPEYFTIIGAFVDPLDQVPSSTITSNATIYVPAGSEDAYRNDPRWGEIKNVDTGIENVAFTNADSEIKDIFDISGRKLSGFKSGLNIVVSSNGKIKKIIR